MRRVGILKLLIGAGLIINALGQIFAHQTWWFIQNVNLIFHEAGHVVFMFFGNFMHTFGGSLLEMLIPSLVTLHFYRSKQLFSAACTSWWMATAFLSVSIYAGDARERLLPLITRDISTHDWFNILVSFNLLEYDDLIGYIFWCLSLLSVGLIVYFLYRDEQVTACIQKLNI
ncbi:hypothetical protein H6784_05430 [Candidatus Nomurabacteria bacterium]|nr:hypothetical protein [Candidatus Kaiserbacteria bacterium]MCB9814821.1 hypothetical protein [Candidatus Nomurabacteria bacterium]